MADDKNPTRALRIGELMTDFRTLEQQIATYAAQNQPQSPQDAALEGFLLLKQTRLESQQLLMRPLPGSPSAPQPNPDAERASLQTIMLDAATRRFVAHRLYLRTVAAVRWNATRRQVMAGNSAQPRNAEALRAVDQRLRQELVAITDERVYEQLKAADVRKGSWVDEDPTLERILAWNRRT